jgi:hypothetical protein
MFASFNVSSTLPIEDSRRKQQVTRLSSQILFQKLGVSFKLPLAVATYMFDILFFFRRNESSLTYDGKPRLAIGFIRLSIITSKFIMVLQKLNYFVSFLKIIN